MSRSGSDRACVVMVDETGDSPEFVSDVAAAHSLGGGVGDILFGVPKTIPQAMEHDDSEYWKAAILDEINNHEEIFHVFGPPIPKQPGMKVTPTRFLFSQKLVSLEERTQDASPKHISRYKVQRIMSVSGPAFFM